MATSKKILHILTFGIIIFLFICTFLSKYISEAMMPKVEVMNLFSIELEIDGEAAVYDRVIPCSAIISGAYESNYVYVVREQKGLFGQEHYAVLLEVQVIASNDIYAAIGGWNITAFDDVVISSSYLSSGEVVKVMNK